MAKQPEAPLSVNRDFNHALNTAQREVILTSAMLWLLRMGNVPHPRRTDSYVEAWSWVTCQTGIDDILVDLVVEAIRCTHILGEGRRPLYSDYDSAAILIRQKAKAA